MCDGHGVSTDAEFYARRDAAEASEAQRLTVLGCTIAERDATIAAMRSLLWRWAPVLCDHDILCPVKDESGSCMCPPQRAEEDGLFRAAISSDAGKDFEARIRADENARTIAACMDRDDVSNDELWNAAVETCIGTVDDTMAYPEEHLIEQLRKLKRGGA